MEYKTSSETLSGSTRISALRRPDASRVLGTAGHIDHGKTALVGALTGVATDRLPEERARGISIELGFAPLDLGPDAPAVSVIDVPGHEAFIRTMVAGATGVDAVLFVVAADEGLMPQSREHLLVLEALGVGRGVVAVTKIDRVDGEWLGLVLDAVREELAGTALEGAPIVPVSAWSGAGLPELRQELARVLEKTAGRHDDFPFRLPVDRAFVLTGVGPVATGTMWGGRIGVGETVAILPSRARARVRSIEVHGAAVDEVAAGRRAALALSGATVDALTRGSVLVAADGPWRAVRRLDADLWLAPGAPRAVPTGGRLRVHHGTAEVLGRVHWYDRSSVDPGGRGVGHLVLETPIVVAAMDRLVLRTSSPVTTIGGGRVLVLGPRRRGGGERAARGRWLLAMGDAPPEGRLGLALGAAGAVGVAEPELPVATGLGSRALAAARAADPESVEVHGGRWFARAAREAAMARLLAAVAAHHARAPLQPGMPLDVARRAVGPADGALVEAAVGTLLAAGKLARRGAALALGGHVARPAGEDARLLAAIRDRYREAGLAAPDTEPLAAGLEISPARLRELQRHLEREGALVKLASDWYVDATAIEGARAALVERLERHGPADVAACKQLFGVSRKFLIPLLEHFDRTGVTRRQGDRRVPAGRAP